MILAFANQKGGVGKTTTAINLGAFLALRGQRVLLLDLDPQSNATSSLGLDKRSLQASIYDVLIEGMPLTEIMLATRVPGLHLIPSVPGLAGAEVELASLPDRAQVLGARIGTLRLAYDWILIDCPPSLGLLTLNALSAADAVVIPVQCEYLALEGLTQLVETIELVCQNLNPALSIFGLVMTMFDARLHLATQVVQQVTAHFPDKVFRTVIPRNVRIAEAPSYGEPLATFDPNSRGGQAYRALADEFMARGGKESGQRSDASGQKEEGSRPMDGEATGQENMQRREEPAAKENKPIAAEEVQEKEEGDVPVVQWQDFEPARAPEKEHQGKRPEESDTVFPTRVEEEEPAPAEGRTRAAAAILPTDIAGEADSEVERRK